MSDVQKFPYYKQEHGWLSSNWYPFDGRKGCAIIYSPMQTTVRMDKVPPGGTPPKPEPAPKSAQSSTLLSTSGAGSGAGAKAQDIPTALGVECKNPKPFDMLDLPDAMEKEKFFVAAELAREWFEGEAYTYDDHPDGPQPIVNTTTVTLGWALRYGKAKQHYKTLYTEDVYTDDATKIVKRKLNRFFAKTIEAGGTITRGMDTLKISGGSVVNLHHDFQFQLRKVSAYDTTDGLGPTDLTAALGNFAFYAAIGEFKVAAEPDFCYSDSGKRQICYVPAVTITHVYVYLKDNYSFNDDSRKSSSQYLGHWNKNGAIVVPIAVGAELANKIDRKKYIDLEINVDFELGNYPVTSYVKLFGGVDPNMVFYPIRNRDFRAWRSKFKQGGDIMVYSDPKKIKLAKPITVTLERICIVRE